MGLGPEAPDSAGDRFGIRQLVDIAERALSPSLKRPDDRLPDHRRPADPASPGATRLPAPYLIDQDEQVRVVPAADRRDAASPGGRRDRLWPRVTATGDVPPARPARRSDRCGQCSLSADSRVAAQVARPLTSARFGSGWTLGFAPASCSTAILLRSEDQCQRLFFIRYRSWSAADSATSESLRGRQSAKAPRSGGGPSIANDSAQNHPCLLRRHRQKQRELVATEPRDHVGCAGAVRCQPR